MAFFPMPAASSRVRLAARRSVRQCQRLTPQDCAALGAPCSAQNLPMTKLLFDFAHSSATQGWTAIDDRVMGGVSLSRLRHDPRGHAVFEGEVSLDRNGGFASVRSSPSVRGQSDARACMIELRGGHKQFKLSLFTDDGLDSLNYQTSFAADSDDWQTLSLPLTDFRPSFRGREIQGASVLDPAQIRQVGLMIAARQVGNFALDIRRISLA